MIMSGELAKGQRLRPEEIADDLGVSRIPVREGLIALDQEGWIKFESNRGAYVTGIEGDAISDHYELRGLVLGLLGRRVAEVATPSDIDVLNAVLRRMRSADDVETFAALNDQFLGRLYELASSPRLIAALLVSNEIIPDRFFELVSAGRATQLSGLGAFVRALKARSADAADHALHQLQSRQGAAVVATLADTGLVDATSSTASSTATPPRPYT